MKNNIIFSIDYRVSKRLFEIIVSKWNRPLWRILKLNKDIIDIQNRFRILTFEDYKGKLIQVCTSIKIIDSYRIAEIYKGRSNVEYFLDL